MRYAILSDIHSNLEALQAVLSEVRRRNIQRYICLGDIVGYGADPRQCLEIVRRLNPLTVIGNHDAAACDRMSLDYFNRHARDAAIWTRGQLSPSERSYLASLPLVEKIGDIILVHSSLDFPEKWYYIFSAQEARPSFDRLTAQVCFYGHSHIPGIFRKRENRISRVVEEHITLEGNTHYLVNVGSVGQPRDGDPRASFCLLDLEARTVEIIRVEYPVEKAQEKILRAGLPPILAARLAVGQ